MTPIETEAVILQVRDYAESDRLIWFYSHTGGKRQGLAKGAKRSRRRFVHTFEPFSIVVLAYRERRSLLWVEACRLVDPIEKLRTDVHRWGYAALISEIMIEMVPEGEPQPELFVLLKQALEQLSVVRDPVNAMLLFFVRFLHLMGYLPDLDRCGLCRRPLMSDRRWWWRIHEGTLSCSRHLGHEDALLLDLGTLVLFQKCRSVSLPEMWRLHFLQRMKLPLLNGLLDWVRWQIGKGLKSARMLRQL